MEQKKECRLRQKWKKSIQKTHNVTKKEGANKLSDKSLESASGGNIGLALLSLAQLWGDDD